MKSVIDLTSAIKGYVDGIDDKIVASINANGSKNILPFDIEHIYENNSEGSWGQTNKSYTREGVKYMVQDDGSVIVNRESASSNTSSFNYYNTTKGHPIPAGVYHFSGLPSAGSSSTFRLRYALYYDDGTNTGWKYITAVDGNDVTINEGCVGLKFGIMVYSGGSPSEQIWKPMICLKSDWDIDPTWEPPTPTNRKLDRDKVDWIAISQIGSVNIAESIADTQVVRGVTLTKQDDGTWTCSADSATSDTIPLVICRAKVKSGQVYKLSGAPSETVCLWVRTANTTSGDNIVAKDAGNGAIFVSPIDGYVYVQIRISEGVTLTSSDVFKPMITPVDYNGPYVPYADTNKGLTDRMESVESDADYKKIDSYPITHKCHLTFTHSGTSRSCVKIMSHQGDLLFTHTGSAWAISEKVVSNRDPSTPSTWTYTINGETIDINSSIAIDGFVLISCVEAHNVTFSQSGTSAPQSNTIDIINLQSLS